MPPIRIAIAARKGGVGKTTLSTGLASAFAAAGCSTAIIDLDPQSNAAFALGVDPSASGTADFLMGRPVIPQRAWNQLDVYAGGPDLTSHAVNGLDAEELIDAASRLHYEVMIFDCPPGSEHLERLALVAATTALVVLDAHPFGISGAARVVEVIANRRAKQRSGPSAVALIPSRIDIRRSYDRELESNLSSVFPGLPIMKVRQDTALAVASADRRPIAEVAADSRGYQDILAIKEWTYAQPR